MRIESSDVARTFAPNIAPSGAETSAQAPTPAEGFEGLLSDAIDHASALDKVASEKVQALAAGETDDIHGTMIAAKEAEISMKLVGTVRNKLLDAFHELWRTNV